MSEGLIWLVAGLALIGLEVAAPGAFMVWIGLAAVGTGLLRTAVGFGFEVQVVVFAALAALALGIGLRLRRRRRRPTLNVQEAGLIGRSAVALSFRGREGRVRVGDSDWAAELADGEPTPEVGAMLRVAAVHGTVVQVRAEPAGRLRPA